MVLLKKTKVNACDAMENVISKPEITYQPVSCSPGENRPEDLLPRFITLKSEDGKDEIYYTTGSRDMPEDVRLYAEKELNETEENKALGIKKLRDIMKREELPYVENFILIAVLRCCKYDIKKSQTKLKKVLNLRNLVIRNVKKVDWKKIEHIMDDGITDCLPYCDKEGRPIYFFRPNMNLDHYDYEDIAATAQACLFSILTYPLPTTKGIAVIVDCKCNTSMYFSMLKAYKKYIGLEKSLPLRIRRIDFVNTNVLVHSIYSILRPFLTSKINDRIAFHGDDLQSLHQIYRPEILPEELGGKTGPTNPKFFKAERMITLTKLRSETLT